MRRTGVGCVLIALAASALTVVIVPANASSPAPSDQPSGALHARTLIDNNKVHATLLEFPVGYLRPTHFGRREDQILVYLDDAAFAPAATRAPDPSSTSVHERGSVEWLPRDLDAPPLRVTKAHRALFIELKHGTLSAPDAAALKLPAEPKAGGGAPTQMLLDNDQVRATLISFPQDFIRPGGFKRRLDTLIVYIDDARLELPGPAQRQYSVIRSLQHPTAIAACDPIKDCDSVGPDGKWVSGSTLVSGTMAWHPKDGFVNKLRIAQGYRALYIELKR